MLAAFCHLSDFFSCCFFFGVNADDLDEVGQIGRAAERLLPTRLVLSPAG